VQVRLQIQRQAETFVAELSSERRICADADKVNGAVLTDARAALRVGAGQWLRLTARLDAVHVLLGSKPRQILDVAAVDAHAPDAADEKLLVARPQVPRKSRRVVHRADVEERS